jgi:hypothetical protein
MKDRAVDQRVEIAGIDERTGRYVVRYPITGAVAVLSQSTVDEVYEPVAS